MDFSRRRWLVWAVPIVLMAANLVYLRIPDADTNTVGSSLRTYRQPWRETWYSSFVRQSLNLIIQPVDLFLCPVVGWGCRFLTADHRVLLEKVWESGSLAALRAAREPDEQILGGFVGVNLRGRNLRFAQLVGSELLAANLTGADLSRANLSDATLIGAKLVGATLQRTLMAGALLTGADLSDASLSEADLRKAGLRFTKFRDAIMQYVRLGEADAIGADFESANLVNAEMMSARMSGANLSFVHLELADLTNARLTAAVLVGADLRGADMRHAYLEGADLEGADLSGTDLEGASLWNVKPNSGTKFGLADLRGSLFSVPLEPLHDIEGIGPLTKQVRQRIADALTPGGQPYELLHVSTSAGPILITEIGDPLFSETFSDNVTTDVETHDKAMGSFMANLINEPHDGYGTATYAPVPIGRWSEPGGNLARATNCQLLSVGSSRLGFVRKDIYDVLTADASKCLAPPVSR